MNTEARWKITAHDTPPNEAIYITADRNTAEDIADTYTAASGEHGGPPYTAEQVTNH